MASCGGVKRFDRATAFLRGLLEEIVANGGTRLPPLRTLSQRADISAPTMYRALQGLKRDGLIRSKPGSGCTIAPQVCIRGAFTREPWLWKPEAVCARIERDIIGGFYKSGQRLLATKEMMARYGASYKTLRKALGMLVEHGSIVPFRRTYKVVAPHPLTDAKKVILFESDFFEASSWWNSDPRVVNFMHILDSVCRSRQLIMERRIWHAGADGIGFSAPQRPRFSKEALADIAGFLIFTPGTNPAFLRNLALTLGTYGRPIAVFDEKYGVNDITSILPTSADIICHTIALHERQGITVGRYLAKLGHTRMAYLAGRDYWQRHDKRLVGLRAAASLAGISGATNVRAVDLGDVRMKPDDEPLRDLERRLQADTGAPNPLVPLVIQAIGQQSSRLNDLIREESIVRTMAPALEEAIFGGVTAFVGYNDEIAALCLRHLRSKGIRVPENVSVVGFDDSPIALTSDLTSYNPNAETALRASIGHLLFRTLLSKKQEKVVVLDGSVSERGSSGPVGGGGKA